MAGRPTKYKPEYCKIVRREMKKGYTKLAVAGTLGITRDTFYEWCKRYPEFSDTVRHGEVLAQCFWENLMREAALGISKHKINSRILLYVLKTRYRWGMNEESPIDKLIRETDEKEAKKLEKKEKHLSETERVHKLFKRYNVPIPQV